MNENVYKFLRDFGFSQEEIYDFENKNEEMYFTNMKEIQKNISFLIDKGISKDEIIEIIKFNPFMLTVKNNRLDALDNIYINILNFSNNTLKELIINNPYCYTESPIELQKIIDYLKENKWNNDSIKNLIIDNPKVLNLTFDSFKEIINN